jgi:predicted acylesterase/phospholipase RssA
VRSGTDPDFLGVWLPGQVLSGIGAGATLPLLGSAALAAVPGGRYATASAVVSSSRQLGGVLGIALLVVIIGTPTPGTATDDLRPGWWFAVAVFAVTAIVALLLGRIPRKPDEESTDSDSGPSVKLPEPAPPASTEVAALPLLGRLPDRVRTSLTEASHDIDVEAGAWLIREGEPADALYLVQEGRLEVLIRGDVVRELGPGAAVGELALLTGGVRSASVRARRDSVVARLSREDFDRIVRTDPESVAALADVLAHQLSDSGPDRTRTATTPSVVSVLALHDGAPAEAVGHALAAELARHGSVASLGTVPVDALHRAERDHDRVVLVAEDPGTDDWRFALRQADHVVLVSRDIDPAASAVVEHDHVDLVLVGARPARERVAGWTERLHPWRTTYADDPELDRALAPVGRALAGRSVGVVMAGGGARAFAHIGVLAELEAAGVVVDRVAGTSIGALIAALYAAGHTPEEIQEVCHLEFVRANPFSDYTLPTVSLAKGRRTRTGMERQFGAALIEELPRQFACVSTDLGTRQRYVHRSGRTSDAVVASLALPVLFPPRRVDGRLLVDGGVLDNLPTTLLTERSEGPVLAVNIALGGSADGERRRPAGEVRPPRIPGLGETLLRTMMISSGGATDAALAQGAAVLTPAPQGVGLLEFHQLDRVVESGRTAARVLLERTDGVIPG